MNSRLAIALTTVLAASGVATSAHALPLLAENAAQNQSSALTLYPDSDNANLFYYMPNASEFATDPASGLPLFGFTYWGLEPALPLDQAGAYMTFSMRLHSDQEQTDALNQAIASGKQIAVLPVQASTIGLAALMKPQGGGAGADPSGSVPGAGAGFPLGALFDEFDFANHAGTAEAEIGVNAVMTGLGAKVIKASIDNPALIKFDYCYQVQGLGPNFSATISLDWQRIYQDYQLHASGGGWWFAWQIDAEVESLRQQNAIVITINGGDAQDEEYVKAVADKIVATLFVPELLAQPVASGQGADTWSFSRAQLKVTSITELKQETWSLTRRQLETQEFCIPLELDGLAKYKDQLVRNADASN